MLHNPSWPASHRTAAGAVEPRVNIDLASVQQDWCSASPFGIRTSTGRAGVGRMKSRTFSLLSIRRRGRAGHSDASSDVIQDREQAAPQRGEPRCRQDSFSWTERFGGPEFVEQRK